MAEVCRATLGDNAYFFFDQYVVKGPEGGLPFGWHQDSGYVVGNGGPVDHAPYLTCWCPLDDATAQNGTVRVLPFSETPLARDWILPHERQAGTNDLVGWKGNEPGLVLEVPAGSVVAFSSHLLHTTGANQTDRMRRVYLAQYTPEVMLNPGTRQLRRNAVPLVLKGEQVTRG
jgi:ectoine hydroxylase-related dioxygenase (phytanoyl-CoA dioxygenase family)